jgi:hypothetical protein
MRAWASRPTSRVVTVGHGRLAPIDDLLSVLVVFEPAAPYIGCRFTWAHVRMIEVGVRSV